MAHLVIRNLDDDVKAKPRHRVRRHGPSSEEEASKILRNAVASPKTELLARACMPCSGPASGRVESTGNSIG